MIAHLQIYLFIYLFFFLGGAYSVQSNIAVTPDHTTEGRECDKEDKGQGKEESSNYSQQSERYLHHSQPRGRTR